MGFRTGDKIAKMEAKLRQLEQPASTLVPHPSLPPKPIVLPPNVEVDAGTSSSGPAKPRAQHARNATPLPSLPLTQARHPLPERPTSSAPSPVSLHHLPRPPKKVVPVMLGVKIKKHKE